MEGFSRQNGFFGLSGLGPGSSSSGPAFALSDLFSEGQAGILLEAGDNTAYFLTDAGSINVSANDDTIGLAFDKRLMGGAAAETFIAAQSELVDTGNTAAAWSPFGNNTVADDDGAVRVTYVDTANGATLPLTAAGGLSTDLTDNVYYRVAAEVRVNTGAVTVRSTNFWNSHAPSVMETTFTPWRATLQARPSLSESFQVISMNAGEIAWSRNLSVKAVPGNHLAQSSSSFRPKHQTATSGRKYDALDDRLPSAVNCAAGDHTLAARIVGPASVDSTQIVAGLQDSTSTRFYLALNTSGQWCAGVGSDGTTTIVGGPDVRGTESFAELSIESGVVTLRVNGTSVYSAAINGTPSTSVPLYEGALNNNGTAAAFFGGEVLDLVFRQGALDSDERTALVNYWS